MSPIRKQDDFRAVEIDSWDEYVEDEVLKLQHAGELDNLPDRGKPIKIWRTDVDPDKDLAFSRLKNAGVLPLWMELDKEIGALTDAIWARLDKVEADLRSLLEQLNSPSEPAPEKPRSPWQRLTAWFRMDLSEDAPPPPTLTTIMSVRDRERQRFLDKAIELDKKISSYHDSLPKGAEHLQRLRWLPARAEKIFDERIKLADWVESTV